MLKNITYILIICFLLGCSSNESYNGIVPYGACIDANECTEDTAELVYTDSNGAQSMWVCDNGIWEYMDLF
jgi:hypothetical protein